QKYLDEDDDFFLEEHRQQHQQPCPANKRSSDAVQRRKPHLGTLKIGAHGVALGFAERFGVVVGGHAEGCSQRQSKVRVGTGSIRLRRKTIKRNGYSMAFLPPEARCKQRESPPATKPKPASAGC